MKSLFGFVLAVFILLVQIGCKPLEQDSVAVAVGIRIDEFLPEEQFRSDLKGLSEKKFQILQIELPLLADSQTIFPKINRTALFQLSKILSQSEITPFQIQVMVTRTHLDQLFPAGKPDSLETWKHYYWQELKEILNRIPSNRMQIFWIGNDFQPIETEQEFWKTITDSVRKHPLHTNLKIGYAARTERITNLPIWQYFDYIGIQNEIPADRNYKMYAKKHHTEISKFSDSLQKNIWITNLNLLETDKLLQCKNSLRFWESKPISGITVNTIYPITAIHDSVTRFGVAKRPDLIQFLQKINHPAIQKTKESSK